MKIQKYFFNCILVTSIFFYSGISHAYANLTPLIIKIQKSYEDIQNFSSKFIQELIHHESGSRESREGILIFKKPLFIRWETKPPYAELLVINNSAVWDYLPEERLAYKYSTDVVKDSTSIIRVITGQERLDKNFSITLESTDGDLIILKLYPNEPTTQMVEALLWINKKTNLISKVQSTDFYGNTNTITLIDSKFNTSIDTNVFHYTPSKNITIENLEDKTTPERRPLLN